MSKRAWLFCEIVPLAIVTLAFAGLGVYGFNLGDTTMHGVGATVAIISGTILVLDLSLGY